MCCFVRSQWVFYREAVANCGAGEMEIEWAYEFDREHDEENRVFLYRLEGNDRLVIFDSDIDHDDGAFRTCNIAYLLFCMERESNTHCVYYYIATQRHKISWLLTFVFLNNSIMNSKSKTTRVMVFQGEEK